ncbi:superinfection immunity protein [Aestuariibacter sp. GS-14]|uniref:superinfection immunity protein n=1 Tax=Aestuariibacter sp. GS-14 TaxID=2590670 RepID=UPI00112C091E|nr:superinfection immunity protein [Aestuariibacter sp. GS-14]TPV59083.1 superinfection immunity protein [Aestuariibacter sp. GS-14]
MDAFAQLFTTADPLTLTVVGALVVFTWFLPALVALLFNRKQFKLILMACVPAGFSLIAWSGVMVWALTGNMVNRFRRKPVEAA